MEAMFARMTSNTSRTARRPFSPDEQRNVISCPPAKAFSFTESFGDPLERSPPRFVAISLLWKCE